MTDSKIYSYQQLIEKLHFEEKLSSKEIANIFGITQSAISVLLSKSALKRRDSKFHSSAYFLGLEFANEKLAEKCLKILKDNSLKVICEDNCFRIVSKSQ
ncbi:MAG: hypothetical protein ACTSXD_06070 [Candidatus Heimdallarchaeaceae archaeon]